jgi:hypothetical protein
MVILFIFNRHEGYPLFFVLIEGEDWSMLLPEDEQY